MSPPDTSNAASDRSSHPTPGFAVTVFHQAAKDLRTSFRDRSTLIQTLLVPLALYPVMFWVMIQANSIIQGQNSKRVLTVHVVPDPGQAEFATELLAEWEAEAPPEEPEEGTAPLQTEPDSTSTAGDSEQSPEEEPASETGQGALAQVEALVVEDGELSPEERLFTEQPPDAVVHLTTLDEGREITIHTDSSRANSDLAGERLSDWFRERGEAERITRSAALGVTLEELAPFGVERVNVSKAEEVGAFVLSLLLPLMLVVMGTLGAFYPAVDLTAGEHERHTHETTLLAPVPRMAIQLGKVLAVTTCSIVAAVMNLIGMALAANHLLGLLGNTGISFELPWANLLLAVPFAAAFLLFVSAVLCAAASLTRTFKQGQSLLGTVQMVFLLPAMVTSMPALQLTFGLAAIPIVGVALAFRTLLRGGPLADLPLVPLALVLVFQILFALIALAVSLRLLDQAPDGDAEASTGDRLRQFLSRARP